ncbi:MAG TPA: electron transfer flavoprotein subunit alpha/FixB family protein [Gaiella sp.]|uniref:electron transfer flavoprotein subunit alpha/FixB family protein n=1 Tax=Gaiella sp. TaxID=2663207 RepID=UPI002D7E5175|nr:electron transfer flavoprotein subunit alpha/FixB family protein [Gaiella sp.]HET9286956.1 electron transfer flavoprotein subunit alpha/FixB family protein [Gaiella sp.]
MSVLVYVEHAAGVVDEPSLQALTLARGLAGGDALQAVCVRVGATQSPADALAGHGVETLHAAAGEAFAAHAPCAIAEAIVELSRRLSASAVVGPGTERGNEVLAHVAGLLDLPLAANCVAAASSDGGTNVTRVRWGGSLLEVARVHAPTALLTVQPHAVPIETTSSGAPAVETFTPTLSDAALALRVAERLGAATGGISLADAKVVVSGGRGAGSAEGFAIVEELAGLLGAAVGCSRAVTMAGWRPHTDQVGQTGTKIAPDLYIACGISGATQHMAGCKGAKRILAVNSDREAPILASADYAVIGDMHEIVPALSVAIRAARSS